MKKISKILILILVTFTSISLVSAEDIYNGNCQLTNSSDDTFDCTYSCNISSNDSYLKFNYHTFLKSGQLAHEIIDDSIEVDDNSIFGFNGVTGYTGPGSGGKKHVLSVSLYEHPNAEDYTVSDKLYCVPVLAKTKLSTQLTIDPDNRSSVEISENQIYIYKDSSYKPDSGKGGTDATCGFLGSENSKSVLLLRKVYGYIKIFVPLLIVILSIIDFVKAVATGKDDDMKKGINKFTKRIMVAIIIILVPAIIKILIGVSGISNQYSGVNDSLKTITCILG